MFTYLLSCVGKALERCVHSHVLNYLKVNNIITQSQSGFMPGDSTVNQLTSIYHDLCTSFDQGITTQSIFSPDTSKAFGRVWHKGLLKKIEAVIPTASIFFNNPLCHTRSKALEMSGEKMDCVVIPKRQFGIMVSKLFTKSQTSRCYKR